MDNNEIKQTNAIPQEVLESTTGRFGAWWERRAGRPLGRKDKVIGAILAVIFLFIFYVALDANKYHATVHVIDGEGTVGVNPTTERLDFGDLSRGTSAVRRVALANGTPMPMYVMVVRTGKVGELMDTDKNYFMLNPRTEEKIEFTVYMPASAEVGATYGGRVYLFKIPTFGI